MELSMELSKPPHNKFIFQGLDEKTYTKYVGTYSKCKKYGFRGISAFVAGTGVKDALFEVTKQSVKRYGRQKIGVFIMGSCGYIIGPAVTLITKSKKVVKVAQITHSCVAFAAECVEDCANLAYIPFDLALFGQPVPIGDDNRFDLFGNGFDAVKNITDDLAGD